MSSQSINHSSFFQIAPLTILSEIISHLVPWNEQSSLKIFIEKTTPLRTVSKSFKNAIDQFLIKKITSDLKRDTNAISKFLNLGSLFTTYISTSRDLTFIDFIQFQRQLSIQIGPCASDLLIHSAKQIQELTQQNKTNLQILWSKLRINIQNAPTLTTAEEISDWLNDPKNKTKLDQITSLDLTYSRISALPLEITKLTQLKYLSLQGSSLRILPPEIGQLTQLHILDVSNTPLSSFPPEIGQLTQLRSLVASYTSLNSLPNEIGQLTQLKSLSLGGTPLLLIYKEILNSYSADFDSNTRIIQFMNERKFVSFSKLSFLYQTIIKSENPREISQEIKNAFKNLKIEDQNRIYEQIDFLSKQPKDWGKNHVFDQPDLFF